MQAYYVTVVEDRLILSAEYRLPLLATTDMQRGLSAIAELLVKFGMKMRDTSPEPASWLKPKMTIAGRTASSGNAALLLPSLILLVLFDLNPHKQIYQNCITDVKRFVCCRTQTKGRPRLFRSIE